MRKSLVNMWVTVPITGQKEQKIIEDYLNSNKKQRYDMLVQILYKGCHEITLSHQEIVIRTYNHQQSLLEEKRLGVSKNRIQPTHNEIADLKPNQRNYYLTEVPKAARAKRKRFNAALKM